MGLVGGWSRFSGPSDGSYDAMRHPSQVGKDSHHKCCHTALQETPVTRASKEKSQGHPPR